MTALLVTLIVVACCACCPHDAVETKATGLAPSEFRPWGASTVQP